MKLFTVTDLERVARLAATRIRDGRSDIEGVTRECVDLVATNTARVYDEFTVLEIAQRAAEISLDASNGNPRVSISEAAVRAFQERTRGH